MKSSMKSFLAATVVSALSLGAAQAQETPQKGGTMVVVIPGGTPRVLNPAVQSGTATGLVGTQLFASPLRYDADWTPNPTSPRAGKSATTA
ncbi:hypothetical protein ACFQFQ_25695 [Sulfitobacter porphyrae]|uniref:Uncharacterized protein n=1 Tax=Sulfitobacter porphyrae TaxID=1246864 RepID=A0ABW2B6M9_9RHOB